MAIVFVTGLWAGFWGVGRVASVLIVVVVFANVPIAFAVVFTILMTVNACLGKKIKTFSTRN